MPIPGRLRLFVDVLLIPGREQFLRVIKLLVLLVTQRFAVEHFDRWQDRFKGGFCLRFGGIGAVNFILRSLARRDQLQHVKGLVVFTAKNPLLRQHAIEPRVIARGDETDFRIADFLHLRRQYIR